MPHAQEERRKLSKSNGNNIVQNLTGEPDLILTYHLQAQITYIQRELPTNVLIYYTVNQNYDPSSFNKALAA